MPVEMFGPYRLDALLSRGGMGEVWRAFDTGKERDVALKLLLESLSADEDFRQRFRREAAITAKLRDPHVIPIHHYGEIDGRLYLDMRLVEGTDLAAVLETTGRLDPARAVAVITQIAAALDAAHNEGLIHRDVKPSNTLLTAPQDGQTEFCYLVDFGIACSATATTGALLPGSGVTIGTPDYMAPEQFLAGPIDHRVDIYALGCVLFEALTSRRPFPRDDVAILLNAHLNQPPPRPTELVTGLPPGFDDVIARALAKTPDQRYPSAGALATAAQNSLTTTAPTTTDPTTPAPPAPHVAPDPQDPATPSTPRPRTPRTTVIIDMLLILFLATGVTLPVTTTRMPVIASRARWPSRRASR